MVLFFFCWLKGLYKILTTDLSKLWTCYFKFLHFVLTRCGQCSSPLHFPLAWYMCGVFSKFGWDLCTMVLTAKPLLKAWRFGNSSWWQYLVELFPCCCCFMLYLDGEKKWNCLDQGWISRLCGICHGLAVFCEEIRALQYVLDWVIWYWPLLSW